MSLFQAEYQFTVSFEDLDPMGIVWHGNYIRYMEQARCNFLSKIGYNYMELAKDGYAYPVAKMKTKFIKSATLDDILIVKTQILSLEPSFDIKYEIFNKKTREKIFQAETMQIAINFKTHETIYTPPARLLKAIKDYKNENI